MIDVAATDIVSQTGQGKIAPAIAVVLSLAVTRLLKSDTKFPIDIGARWQPVIVVILGQAFTVLQAIVGGVPWRDAVVQGLYVSFFTMGLFDLVAKAIFGTDTPWWLRWLIKPEAMPQKGSVVGQGEPEKH